jgi:hypothetical protein
MLNVGVHSFVRQPVGLRVLSYVRQHAPTWLMRWESCTGVVAKSSGVGG